ncbi:MAG: amidase [Oceanospirillaceae bacterium]|tara:strand:+ start:1898 stop:3307 length:1410 start_codon:yes stop_codon:yes gene_type:complete
MNRAEEPFSKTNLIARSALQLVVALRCEQVSPHELLDALEQQINLVDGAINALPTLCFKRARKHADALMQKPVSQRGLLCGLPVAIKDLNQVAGVIISMGSPIFKDRVAINSDYMVEQIEQQGGIIYAISNSPEFGAGGNTFNDVYGFTRNPKDLAMTVAGSSGGAAAALASGSAWLAQGSDNAGSLRSPAGYCGIVGMRPSIGRVANGPSATPYDSMAVNGPMARNVEDVALFLDAMSEEDSRDPFSLPKPKIGFLTTAQMRKRPLKVAFSPDLGITPVDPEIASICEQAAMKFKAMGAQVDFVSPDFTGVHSSYQTLRAHSFAMALGGLYKDNPSSFKAEIVENIERGLNLTAAEIAQAELTRGVLRARMGVFFEDYDLLLCPTSIVPPFPVEQRYVDSCNGVEFSTYIDWLAIVYAITLVSLPALSLPCGYTESGMPVGLQMICRHRGDADLLSYALSLQDQFGEE